MSSYEVLVGAEEFWKRARADIAGARQRVLLQAMTFEGDETGLRVGRALVESGAWDRRVLVDAYSRVHISDRFVFTPAARRDSEFQREVRETRDMFHRLDDCGVGVRFTNPLGPLLIHFPQRNHKKLVVVDERVAYIGGINFSDHNFAWHDLMVRIEHPEIAQHLAADFDATWRGERGVGVARFDEAMLVSTDGSNNHQVFAEILDLVAGAESSVHVLSPYLTFPFCDALADAQRRGVAVTLVTPEANNKGIVRDYLLWEARRCGFDVRLYDRMSHVKAMLIDDRALVLGSSNFDFVSYHTQDELVAVLTAPEALREFRTKVLEPDLRASRPLDVAVDPWRGRVSFWMLKVAEGATRLSRRLVPSGHRARLANPAQAYRGK